MPVPVSPCMCNHACAYRSVPMPPYMCHHACDTMQVSPCKCHHACVDYAHAVAFYPVISYSSSFVVTSLRSPAADKMMLWPLIVNLASRSRPCIALYTAGSALVDATRPPRRTHLCTFIPSPGLLHRAQVPPVPLLCGPPLIMQLPTLLQCMPFSVRPGRYSISNYTIENQDTAVGLPYANHTDRLSR